MSVDLIIQLSRELTPDEIEALFRFEPEPFGSESLGYSWAPKELHFVGRVDGAPLSHVGLLKTAVTVGNTNLSVAGLGGVITRPEARNHHYAQTLITAAMRYARETWQTGFGMLFCWPHNAPFYSRQGWRPIEAPVTVEQPAGPVSLPLQSMYLTLTSLSWPPGEVRVPGLPW